MKLWKIPHMIDSGKCAGTTFQQKGWDVYCKIGGYITKSWFTSPPTKLIADRIYLIERGYIKISTDKRLMEFKRLWEELFAEKESEGES
jgi:hypothetical protein